MASLDDLFTAASPPRARFASPPRSPLTPARGGSVNRADPLFLSPTSHFSPSPAKRSRPNARVDDRDGRASTSPPPARRERPVPREPWDDGPSAHMQPPMAGASMGAFDFGALGANALDGLDALPGDDDGPVRKRRPIAKVDDKRLTDENGLPALMRAAKSFKVKGKGHEMSDLTRLLDVYQMWAHHMFPKGDFLHTIHRVEAVCRTRKMQAMVSGYRDAFNPPPSPPLSPVRAGSYDHVVHADDHEGAERATVDGEGDIAGQPSRTYTSSPAASLHQSSEPLFEPHEPDDDEMAELEAMAAEEAAARAARMASGEDGPPILDEEDEWEGLYD